MALILGLDPGYKVSALVAFDTVKDRPLTGGIWPNEEMLLNLTVPVGIYGSADLLVLEQMQMFRSAFGVGAEVFDSVFWTGRFAQAWHPKPFTRLLRATVRGHLHAIKGGDPAVRAGLLLRFGGYREVAIGTKKKPGPLYGIKSHMWSALALAVTYHDTIDQRVAAAVLGDF